MPGSESSGSASDPVRALPSCWRTLRLRR
jgi:hypothetical protein